MLPVSHSELDASLIGSLDSFDLFDTERGLSSEEIVHLARSRTFLDSGMRLAFVKVGTIESTGKAVA